MKALLNGEIDAAIIANQPTEMQIQGDILYYEQFYAYVARNESVFKKRWSVPPISATNVFGY